MSVHIVYRDFEPTDALDAYIRRHIEKLEAHVLRVVSCNVALEAPHRHKHGRSYRVHIDLAFPGAELVIDREPRRGHDDAYVAIDDAFDHVLRHASEYAQRGRSRSLAR